MPSDAEEQLARSLAQVLGTSRSTEEWRSLPGRVHVRVNEADGSNKNAQWCLGLLVNTLLRVGPIVTAVQVTLPRDAPLSVRMPLLEGSTLEGAIRTLAARVGTQVTLEVGTRPASSPEVYVGIGCQPAGKPGVSVASDGWIARISGDEHHPRLGNKANPIGAFVAACLAGVEVFKELFVRKADVLMPIRQNIDVRHRIARVSEMNAFSALTYRQDRGDEPNPHLPHRIDMGDVTVAGVGAGGGAAVFALASIEGLSGTLRLVDPDEIVHKNLERYIYATAADADQGRKKVERLAELFVVNPRVAVDARAVPYQDLPETVRNSLQTVVATVDNAKTRTSIQYDLPRTVLDAAVTQTEFFARRIVFGETACGVCTHRDAVGDNGDAALAALLGLSVVELEALRTRNDRPTERQLAIIDEKCRGLTVPSPTSSERFNDWFLRHCGQLYVSGSRGTVSIPLPYTTVLPGVLIAGELLKAAAYPEHCLKGTFVHDIAATPVRARVIAIPPTPDCPLCSHRWALARYAEKHAERGG